jgi:hypothetical protein
VDHKALAIGFLGGQIREPALEANEAVVESSQVCGDLPGIAFQLTAHSRNLQLHIVAESCQASLRSFPHGRDGRA